MWATPSWSKTALPNTITLWVRNSTHTFWRDTNIPNLVPRESVFKKYTKIVWTPLSKADRREIDIYALSGVFIYIFECNKNSGDPTSCPRSARTQWRGWIQTSPLSNCCIWEQTAATEMCRKDALERPRQSEQGGLGLRGQLCGVQSLSHPLWGTPCLRCAGGRKLQWGRLEGAGGADQGLREGSCTTSWAARPRATGSFHPTPAHCSPGGEPGVILSKGPSADVT